RLVINTDVGSILPIAGTAIGLAYLVAAPVKERTQIIDSLYQRFPEQQAQLRENIERAHADYARHGFVVTQRSWGREINGVATAFTPTARNTLFAFHIAGPASQLPVQRLRKELGPLLLAMAEDIRTAMKQPQGPRLAPPEVYKP
ncbi:MAG: IclR family transcriptional regulator, partial [Burkholderiaceae bacterium]|nr:IclR family transcriptional regulator [Burkholderiaceae bacterium]